MLQGTLLVVTGTSHGHTFSFYSPFPLYFLHVTSARPCPFTARPCTI